MKSVFRLSVSGWLMMALVASFCGCVSTRPKDPALAAKYDLVMQKSQAHPYAAAVAKKTWIPCKSGGGKFGIGAFYWAMDQETWEDVVFPEIPGGFWQKVFTKAGNLAQENAETIKKFDVSTLLGGAGKYSSIKSLKPFISHPGLDQQMAEETERFYAAHKEDFVNGGYNRIELETEGCSFSIVPMKVDNEQRIILQCFSFSGEFGHSLTMPKFDFSNNPNPKAQFAVHLLYDLEGHLLSSDKYYFRVPI